MTCGQRSQSIAISHALFVSASDSTSCKPTEGGIILIRGPRQFGKSTWLELEIKRTLRCMAQARVPPGTVMTSLITDELETRGLEVISLFRPKAAVQRLFIDGRSGGLKLGAGAEAYCRPRSTSQCARCSLPVRKRPISVAVANGFPGEKEARADRVLIHGGVVQGLPRPVSARSWAMIRGKPTC